MEVKPTPPLLAATLLEEARARDQREGQKLFGQLLDEKEGTFVKWLLGEEPGTVKLTFINSKGVEVTENVPTPEALRAPKKEPEEI